MNYVEILALWRDFDWLKEVELIGELSFENLCGSEAYGIQYSGEWLKNHIDILLGDDINNYSGMQYT